VVASYNGAMSQRRITGALIALLACLVAAFAIQYFLISQSYTLERRDFSFAARQEAAAAFYGLQHDSRALTVLAREVLDGAVAAGDRPEIARRARAAFAPYAGFDAALSERFRARRIGAGFASAVTLGTLVFRDSTRLHAHVDARSPGEDVLLFGSRDAVVGGELNSSFHFTGDGYYARVNLYLDYPRLQSYLVGRMAGLLAATAVAALGFAFAVAFVLHTLVAQKRFSDTKSDFINTITHELNTPISTIAVAAENLRHERTGADTTERIRLAEVILRQDRRLQRMVENVTRLALLERNDLVLAEKPVALHALLAAVVADFRTRCGGQVVTIAESYTAGNDLVRVDPSLLTSVLVNLLDNAVKHGGAAVDITVGTARADGAIAISVADNGPGIPDEEQRRIFDKLYRARRGRGQHTTGLGIGLYTARRIVEAHGGAIAVARRPVGGSVFTISLPIGEGTVGEQA
jgi:signal transduction histidine kinase